MANQRRGHNEGSVYYEDKRDRWVAAISLENGKRKKASCKTKQEAIRKKNEMLREAGLGILPTGPNQKLKDYLPDWLENVQKDKIRVSSYVKYQLVVKIISEELGDVYLTKLTPERVKRFYNKKLQEGLSTKYVHSFHEVLHVALETAVAWGYIPRNVCDLIDPPRVTSREGTPITVEQARLLLEQAKEHRLEVLLTMAIVTGMRRGELFALRWSSVDLERGMVVVLSTVNYIHGHGHVETTPKTKAGKRTISLPPFLIDMLKEHKRKQEGIRAKAGTKWEEKNLVFPTMYGGFLYPNNVREEFQQMLERAGLPHMHFHDLRHSAATILLTMGMNVKVIQELLGHSKIAIPLDTYSHVLPSLHQGAASTMHDLFAGP